MSESPPTELKVLSYNILDVELESNFVPRTMNNESKDAINKADFLSGYAIPINTKTGNEMTKFEIIEEAYKPFHSGKFHKEGKSAARRVWGQEEPYTNGENKNLIQTLIDLFGNKTTDEKLPGKATELYKKIKSGNFTWVENRLERVYQKIIENDPHIICLQEYGNCKYLPRQQENDSFTTSEKTSTFDISQNQLNDNKREKHALDNSINKDPNFVLSLPERLINDGYTYKLFSYNPVETEGDDGVAIFYKTKNFKISSRKYYVDMDNKIKSKYEVYTTQRGCGLLELTIDNTQQKVIICTTHIQTKSNEKVQDDTYAIRSGELTYIKDYINETYTNTNDKVIFCGDFNLDLNKPADKAVVDEFEKDNILKRIKYNVEHDDIGLVTSYPSGRKEYIDYFFTNCGGTVSKDYKNLEDITDTIPNGTDQPSDHIPILLTIDFPQKPNGGKSRKRRRKTQRKKQRKTRRKGQRKSRR